MKSQAPVNPFDAILLLSGGLDSAANLAIARDRGMRLLVLTVNYGQRAWGSEQRAVQALCDFYGAEMIQVDLPWLGALGGSALTDPAQVLPVLKREVLDDPKVTEASAARVWVPNRNGVFIHLAAAIADARGIPLILVGFNREEAATFPDNTLEYLEAESQALQYSTAHKVRVGSFTAHWDKREIVQALRGLKTPFPFERVWSCYESGEKPCQKCESCQRQMRATDVGDR